MPDYTDFNPLYDWSLLEKGVQDYFVSSGTFVAPPGETDPSRETWLPPTGVIPFFTALEEQLFQKHRPRVSVDINEINPLKVPAYGKVDANGVVRNHTWKAGLVLTIVTPANYTYHTALRAEVFSLGQLICPMVANPQEKIGVNQFLTKHCFNTCVDAQNSTGIHPEQGHYISTLNFNLTFSIRPDAWPV